MLVGVLSKVCQLPLVLSTFTTYWRPADTYLVVQPREFYALRQPLFSHFLPPARDLMLNLFTLSQRGHSLAKRLPFLQLTDCRCHWQLKILFQYYFSSEQCLYTHKSLPRANAG